MKKYFLAIAIFFILCLAGFLYFYKLEEIPSGFYVDEASVAYNAISIFKTGKDEYGFLHPLAFRLMGSYSPPLFIYSLVSLLKLFEPSILVFRSVSAVSVLISILFFYKFARKIGLYKFEFSYFVITLFYSISPWMVFNARLGYETTFGFLLFNIGAFFLFKALNKPKNLIIATVFLSISAYASYNQRFLAPLFLAAYLLVFNKLFLNKKTFKIILTAVLAGFVIQIPNLFIITTPAFWTKTNQFDLKYFWMILTYLSPKTLFYANPDIDLQHTIPKISMMFNWMVIPYFIGIYLMIKGFKNIKYKFLIFYFIVSILPSIFSSQFVSSQRVLPFVIPLSLVIGLGIDRIFKYLKPIFRYLVIALLFCYSLLMLYVSYFVLFPKERAGGWNFGYSNLAEFIKERPREKFLVDDTRNPRLYVLLLYFLKVPPGEYQKKIDPYFKNNYYNNPPMADSFSFANVEVRAINWEKDPKDNLFIVGDELAISGVQMKEHGLTLVAELKDPLKNTIFKIYKTYTAN
jgi:hypothetical protein